MIRLLAAIAFPLAICSCATGQVSDYSLQWDSQSATLYVFSADGAQIPALGDATLAVPGYLIAHGAIHMHPGDQTLSYACPRSDDIVITDGAPSVHYNFQAGHVYELRCRDGVPVIVEREHGA